MKDFEIGNSQQKHKYDETLLIDVEEEIRFSFVYRSQVYTMVFLVEAIKPIKFVTV